jgi:hypothetical protein
LTLYYRVLVLQKLYLLKYSDVTQKSIVITLLYMLVMYVCDVLCIIILIIIPHNNSGYDQLSLLRAGMSQTHNKFSLFVTHTPKCFWCVVEFCVNTLFGKSSRDDSNHER